jgi:general secretion pathway protein D
MNLSRRLALAVSCAFASVAVPGANLATAQQPQSPAQGAPPAGAVSLREIDIRAFIEDVANVTGRTFIVDPRVTGKVTVIATDSLSESELFDVFLSTLRVNGFAATPTNSGAYRIVPDEIAARDPSTRASGSDAYVTQVFQLQFAEAESVANAVKPMLSARGSATTIRRGNALVVVDFGSTVARVREIVGRLDQDRTALRTVHLDNMSADDMVRALKDVISAEQLTTMQVVPIVSSNTVVLRGEPGVLDRYMPLVRELDVKNDMRRGVAVIPLRFASTEEVVPVLQQISATMDTPLAAAGAPPSANRRANIASHKGTNSLIISADPEIQQALAEVVRSLDTRRQQVLVEAVIVEVSDTAAQELGLQLLLAGDGKNTIPFLSTSYSNSAPNLLAATGALLLGDQTGDGDTPNTALLDLQQAAISSLLNVNGGIFGVGGQRDDGSILGLVVNALGRDQGSNVLSTPSVLTLDNEKASILVGQQIPVTTGESLGSDNQNPFRTIRREDIGVQLEVTPQISAGGAIRLNIRQEVSSIFGPVTPNSADLITNKREITTIVQADPGQIIVLGGLIQDDVGRTEEGIPGLRKLPVVGRLFRSEGKSHTRTNLMIFLRPTIVSTPEQASAATQRQFQAVQGFQGLDPAMRAQIERDFFEPLPPAPIPSAPIPSAPVPSAPVAPSPDPAPGISSAPTAAPLADRQAAAPAAAVEMAALPAVAPPIAPPVAAPIAASASAPAVEPIALVNAAAPAVDAITTYYYTPKPFTPAQPAEPVAP